MSRSARFALALIAGAGLAPTLAAPARSDAPDPERRVAELLSRMTLEEKIAQLRPVARRLSLKDDGGGSSVDLKASLLEVR